MAESTLISWARHTFNPWIGCTKVSNGERGACANCYAENWGHRFGVAWGSGAPRRRTSESNWRQPISWDRAAAKAGERPFVFCASLADILDNEVPIQWLADVVDLARRTPNLIWLFLTKRAPLIIKRLREALAHLGLTEMPKNIALGISVVTQEEAERDIPWLLRAKAALNPAFAFVSMEPLMEAVKLCIDTGSEGWDFLSGGWYEREDPATGPGAHHASGYGPKLDWVITGGESGAHARPSHPDWFRSLRDQCQRAGTAFHFKQWGEWRWAPDRAHFKELTVEPWRRLGSGMPGVRPALMVREGKKRTGRELDGRTWDELPKVAA
jgi:protein gp37